MGGKAHLVYNIIEVNDLKRVKCFFKTTPEFGYGGKKIEESMKKYSDDIIFVDTFEECDFMVLHAQVRDSFNTWFKPEEKPTAVLISEFEIFDGEIDFDKKTKLPILPPKVFDFYQDIFSRAKIVYTFQPLKEIGFKGNLVRGPWGVDTLAFPDTVSYTDKVYDIMCFGPWTRGEFYPSIYKAMIKTSGKMVHVGYRPSVAFDMGRMYNPKYAITYGTISDERLIELYKSTKFVSGLRSGMGFETQVLEGVLCGCRPICFDNPYYTKWYKEFALFIPEDFPNIPANLVEVMKDYKAVTQEEADYVKQTYGWWVVGRDIWRKVLQSV